jgi:ABC-2 type transport system permease protein
MSLYLYIFHFRFLRFFIYPFEIAAHVGRRIVEILGLVLLWNLILQNSPSDQNVYQITSYFLIAMGVSEITMAKWGAFTSYIANCIRDGKLSNYLIKPVSILPILYFYSLGTNGVRVIIAFFLIILGIFFNPPTTLFSVFLFLIFMALAISVAFAYNLFLGSIYFHIAEAGGIRNSVEHMSRVLSGSILPLIYFPQTTRSIVELLPFQVMVYGPTKAIQTPTFSKEVANSLLVAIFWAIFANLLAYTFWRKSLKKYEASGI